MVSMFNNLFGDHNEKDLRHLENMAGKINSLEPWASGLNEEQFPVQTEQFKERLEQGESLDDLLPEAFALVREAAKRMTGMRFFDVQLIGATVLHQGRIAEMKAGEGKTLAATLPAYLNALNGKGVHVVTVNDYLARCYRDWMGTIYEYLGLTVGLIVQGLEPTIRRDSYGCDITYATNSELGFDYLRDNMVLYKGDMVQRGQHYAILDEVDNILIDEAQGSLIINSEVESKEEVGLQTASHPVASITIQNYFRMYDKISGMTRTALTEEEEFRSTYGMDVLVIPSNKPLIREEKADLTYKTEQAKLKAVIQEIIKCQQLGQPVLVGTVSVKKSEMLSQELKRHNIAHEVLNAVNQSREAYIIAQAGRKGAVTISTNMGGRGTGIILGGNPEYMVQEKLENEFGMLESELDENDQDRWQKRYNELIYSAIEEAKRQRKEIVELGGLHVLGTERHENRRLDFQLRECAGRHGEPGSSQIFVSLEDDLILTFGDENIVSLMEQVDIEEDMPIDHSLVSRGVENAQKKAELCNYEIRKSTMEYEDVFNAQREVIYGQRRRVLEGESMKEAIEDMTEEVVDCLTHEHTMETGILYYENARALLERAESLCARSGKLVVENLVNREKNDVKAILLEEARALYQEREAAIKPEIMRELERVVLLKAVDRHWTLFIDAIHQLRHEIHTQAYTQRNPLVEYRRQSFEMFENMICKIQDEVVRAVYKVEVTTAPQKEPVPTESKGLLSRVASVFRGKMAETPEPVSADKIGPNEACPCGSGKKHKKCCGH